MKKRTLLTALLLLLFASIISGVLAVCYTAADLIHNRPVKPSASAVDNNRITADIFIVPSGILGR